jgi:transcriptional regulator with XRE-family HTH domain
VSLDRETVALTYADLAERLGIEVASAKTRATRSRWHRTRSNDGRALVHVPIEALAAAKDQPRHTAPQAEAPPHLAHEAELRRLQENHQAELRRLEENYQAELRRLQEIHEAWLRRQDEATKATHEAHRMEVERLAKQVDKLTEPWPARLLRLFRSGS